MALKLNKLSARAVATVKEGLHGDGGGLYLRVSATGARSWVFIWRVGAKRSEIGLGPLSAVTLAQARQKAAERRALIAEGRDPREARGAVQRAIPYFGDVADALIAAKGQGWRNDKHRAQWAMTLAEYAKPLRAKPVDKICTEDVLAVLRPIWMEKPETASRLRGRIEAVLDAAKAQGLRSGENPAVWRGHLSHLLPARQKLTRGHHAALPYDRLPAFMVELREVDGASARALEFTILSACRSGEALGACWGEIDMASRVWTIPAGRMKAGREHRVPLTPRMVEILEAVAPLPRRSDHVFPGARGGPLSVMALAMCLRRMGQGVTVHGFRSSFRDWAGNETHFPREVAEQALAHVIGDKAEQAYRRGDALEKRRALMEEWAKYCEGQQSSS